MNNYSHTFPPTSLVDAFPSLPGMTLSLYKLRQISSPSHSRALFLSDLPLSFSHSLLEHAVAGGRPRHHSLPRCRASSEFVHAVHRPFTSHRPIASPELRRPSSTRPRSTTTTLVPWTVEHPPSSTSIPVHEQKNKVENNPEIFIF
jgi:hypothetical protein